MIFKSVNARTATHSYPIYIGSHLLQSENIANYFIAKKMVVVTQQKIADLHANVFDSLLSGDQRYLVCLPDGEQHKNLQTWQHLLEKMVTYKCDRHTLMVAVGGGVVGDVTGFSAACYYRGVSYIQIPTTLTAQVDSAIGGKTGVNHMVGKNIVGVYHHPICVLADINLLSTLPEREFIAGLAEIIKYALICDTSFFVWLEHNLARVLDRDEEALSYVIFICVSIKANIVNQGECERSGLRHLLNFGHTFGHALEAYYDYQGILHGEAVGIGIGLATILSQEMGWMTAQQVERIRKMLIAAKLLKLIGRFPTTKDFLNLMEFDKKATQGCIHFILLKSIGYAVMTADVSVEKLSRAIDGFCASWMRAD
jgi:3-dehydroquinate synthase